MCIEFSHESSLVIGIYNMKLNTSRFKQIHYLPAMGFEPVAYCIRVIRVTNMPRNHRGRNGLNAYTYSTLGVPLKQIITPH